eukprot:5183493-Amphidinium_carterae.1
MAQAIKARVRKTTKEGKNIRPRKTQNMEYSPRDVLAKFMNIDLQIRVREAMEVLRSIHHVVRLNLHGSAQQQPDAENAEKKHKVRLLDRLQLPFAPSAVAFARSGLKWEGVTVLEAIPQN